MCLWHAPESDREIAHPLPLDVFRLGKIGFRLVMGRAPATDSTTLKAMLLRKEEPVAILNREYAILTGKADQSFYPKTMLGSAKGRRRAS